MAMLWRANAVQALGIILAASIGVAAIFMETHPDPDKAPSDGPNMIPMDEFETLLTDIKRFDDLSKSLL